MTVEIYTKLFKLAESKKHLDENEYIKKHSLEGKGIISTKHPDYFKIDAEWKNIRAELDAPFLEKAYYKIGDELMFVKQNTYDTNENNPNLLVDKKRLTYTIYDAADNNNVNPNHGRTIYYENVLCKGIVTEIHTSDDGSSDIVYCFDELIPKCPETNPYILEKDVISKCEYVK